jgi:hypothetical protein
MTGKVTLGSYVPRKAALQTANKLFHAPRSVAPPQQRVRHLQTILTARSSPIESDASARDDDGSAASLLGGLSPPDSPSALADGCVFTQSAPLNFVIPAPGVPPVCLRCGMPAQWDSFLSGAVYLDTGCKGAIAGFCERCAGATGEIARSPGRGVR